MQLSNAEFDAYEAGETSASGGWLQSLLNGATQVGVAAITHEDPKKKKKANYTPFILLGGALVLVVVLILVFKRK